MSIFFGWVLLLIVMVYSHIVTRAAIRKLRLRGVPGLMLSLLLGVGPVIFTGFALREFGVYIGGGR